VPSRAIELILARQLASGLRAATIVVDPDGIVVGSSDAAERWLAPGTEASLLPFRRPDGGPLAPEEQPVTVALRDRRPVSAVIVGEGSAQPVQVLVWPLESSDGELAGAIVGLWPAGTG
jgi:hypothetical protein